MTRFGRARLPNAGGPHRNSRFEALPIVPYPSTPAIPLAEKHARTQVRAVAADPVEGASAAHSGERARGTATASTSRHRKESLAGADTRNAGVSQPRHRAPSRR